MKLTNILFHLYSDPWPIVPSMHRTLCEIVRDHVTGAAHLPAGRVASFMEDAEDIKEDEDKECVELPAGIAQITIEGVITQKCGALEKMSGACDILDARAQLRKCMADDNVKGILLYVDSPGGCLPGVPELAEEIQAAATVKPIVTFCDGLLASAAYWLGCAAGTIIASPSAQIGSIGVYQAFLDDTRAFEMEGYKMELFKTGKFKGMGIEGLPLTDEQRQLLQDGVDTCFAWFKDFVSVMRGKLPDECFEGQTFYAQQSKDLGLIDFVGSYEDALDELGAQTSK